MPKAITEDEVEQIALELLRNLSYNRIYGPDIAPAPDGKTPGREDYSDTVLKERLRKAIKKINPEIPDDAREEALKKTIRSEHQNIIEDNYAFHKLLTDGVDVSYKKDGRIVHDKVWLFDFEEIDNNDFLAVNQFTIIENDHNRRPDIVLFINGLPLVVIELKNPADQNATI